MLACQYKLKRCSKKECCKQSSKVFVYIIRLIPPHTYHRSRVIKCIEYRCKSIMQLGCSLHNLQEWPPA